MTRFLQAALLGCSLLPLAGAPGARAADLDDYPPPPRYERRVVEERPVIVERPVVVERPVIVERRVLVERPVPFYHRPYYRQYPRPYAEARRFPPYFERPYHRHFAGGPYPHFADGPRFERPYGY